MELIRNLSRAAAVRAAVSIAGAFTAMTLTLFGFIYWQTAVHERALIDELISREALLIAGRPAETAAAALGAWIAEDLHGVRYAGLFGSGGEHLGGNLLEWPAGLVLDGQAHPAVFEGVDRDREAEVPEVVRAVATRLAEGRRLVIGYDLDALEELKDLILRALGLSLLPTVALSIGGGVVLARRAQRRITSINTALERIMRGQLGERLPVRGRGDEVDRLAAAVNGTLQEIEQLVDDLRGIGNNIAHELRTPLMRVRTRLERSRDEACTPEAFQASTDRAIDSVDQALAVVSATLRIGEIEHGRRRAAFRVLDLADVATAAYELYEPLAEAKGIDLQLIIAGSTLVVGDHALLVEATGNLIDNAVKFAPEGSRVTLSIERNGGRGILRVIDRGPGIADAERHLVLRRFYRSERSRRVEGSGLGLSLVQAIAALHGFTLEIGDGAPGCVVDFGGPLYFDGAEAG